MSINGLGLNQNLFSSIDKVSAIDVTKEIFSRASEKTIDLSKTDLSVFKRPTLGVDLYITKTSLELQRQIAITQSGINTQNIDTSFLNAQAAAALYSGSNTVKNVEGKLFVPTDNVEVEPQKVVETIPAKVDFFEIANLNKDAKGSNPFAYGKQQQDEKEENSLQLIA